MTPKELTNWIRGETPVVISSGALCCAGDDVWTYDVHLAHVNRNAQSVYLNMKRYSVTSSRHRNAVELAARDAGYRVVRLDGEPEQAGEPVRREAP